jgi:hypothetical protein
MISLLLTLAAAAATPATPPAAVDKGQNTRVCKRFPPPVGTRLGERKICKTKAEWEQERAETMMVIGKAQQQRPRVGE